MQKNKTRSNLPPKCMPSVTAKTDDHNPQSFTYLVGNLWKPFDEQNSSHSVSVAGGNYTG